jgi:two-component system sensor kinase FixL
MNWIETTWMLLAGMSLALGTVQLVAWLQRREALEHLIYAVFALGAAFGTATELRMLMASSADEYARGLRVIHFGFGPALLCMPLFVYVRFHAGRRWLLYSATALRVFVLGMAVVTAQAINLSNLHIRELELAGIPVAVPLGSFTPRAIPAHLNLLLMLAYFVDVLHSLHARGNAEEYRSGLRICGSMIVFILLSGGQTVAVTYGLLEMPYLVSPAFLLPVLVLAYELGMDQSRTGQAVARLGQSESRLRESEERWQVAGQIAGIAPWSWYASTGELSLSPKAREMFGITSDGRARIEDWLSRVHPDDAERVRRDVQSTMAAEASFERNYRMLMPDGHVRWIGSRGRIERDAAGAVTAMHGVSFDLTEMRQVDAMFRAALEAAPNAIFLVDEAGRIQLANARASRLFGYSNDEMQLMPFELLVPEWIRHPERRHRNLGSPTGAERRSRTREAQATRRGGGRFPVELDLRTLESGLVMASVSDITDRRNAEQESAQQRTELAHLSRVAVLGEMSASLAHELNQPLTAILSNAQAALRFLDAGPELQGELRETLQDIAASGTRAGDVIRRLRAMLKKEDMQRMPLDVNQLIGEVLQLYRTDLISRGVSVHPELGHGLPAVLGDRVQLQQVLLNLVINACDAMANVAGERRLCICSRRLAGDEVEFRVCDVGTGIAPDRLELVFEPFETSKPAGMGLGLSVCKTIVKSHGGRIWANNNTNGPGASFHVALSARAEQQASHAATAELDRT